MTSLPGWAKASLAAAVAVVLVAAPRACERAVDGTPLARAAGIFTPAPQADLASDPSALGRFADVAEIATEAVVRIESRMTTPEPRADIPDMLEGRRWQRLPRIARREDPHECARRAGWRPHRLARQRLGEVEPGQVTALTVVGPPGAERLVTLRVPA